MMDLAMHQHQGPVSLKDLASRQETSAKYLEQLLIPLKAAGLVKSVRGAKGGYLLSQPPESITLYDVVTVLEGPLALVDCVESPESCDRHRDCATHSLWQEMSAMLMDHLRSISLAQLADQQKNMDKKKA